MLSIMKDARGLILRLQDAMLALPHAAHLDDSKMVRHFFENGVYARELSLPAGALVVGKLHREEHIFQLHRGRIQFFSDAGLEDITAPAQFISPAGAKRVILAMQDSVMTTYHENEDNTQDLAQLEQRLIAPDYKELQYVMDGSGDDGRIDGIIVDRRIEGSGGAERSEPEPAAPERP